MHIGEYVDIENLLLRKEGEMPSTDTWFSQSEVQEGETNSI